MAVGKGARLLAVAAFLSGSMLGPSAYASITPSHCPDGQPCVAVIVDGSVVDTFTSAQIEAGDIQNSPVYEVRQPHGAACTDSDPIAAGTSIYSLLSQATVSLTDIGHVEVTSPGVASLDLTAAQVSANGAGQFYDGQVPVVYGNGTSSSLAFIRGLLASPAPCPPAGPAPGADSNAGAQGDFFGVAEIDLTVYGGPTLDVTMTPSAAAIQTGQDVVFTAAVAGGGSASYAYHWSFGDGGGTTTSVSQVSYPYDVAGSYTPQVTVDGSDGSTGVSAPITVTVGGKPTTTGTTPHGGGATPTPGPSAGPTKGTGHRAGAPAGAQPGTDTRNGRPNPAASFHPTAVHRRPGATTQAHTTVITGQLLGTPIRFVPAAASQPSSSDLGSAPAAAAGSGNSPLALSCGIAVAALLVAAGAARELRRAAPATRTVSAGEDGP